LQSRQNHEMGETDIGYAGITILTQHAQGIEPPER
jgi:hypothetical protein